MLLHPLRRDGRDGVRRTGQRAHTAHQDRKYVEARFCKNIKRRQMNHFEREGPLKPLLEGRKFWTPYSKDPLRRFVTSGGEPLADLGISKMVVPTPESKVSSSLLPKKIRYFVILLLLSRTLTWTPTPPAARTAPPRATTRRRGSWCWRQQTAGWTSIQVGTHFWLPHRST